MVRYVQHSWADLFFRNVLFSSFSFWHYRKHQQRSPFACVWCARAPKLNKMMHWNQNTISNSLFSEACIAVYNNNTYFEFVCGIVDFNAESFVYLLDFFVFFCYAHIFNYLLMADHFESIWKTTATSTKSIMQCAILFWFSLLLHLSSKSPAMKQMLPLSLRCKKEQVQLLANEDDAMLIAKYKPNLGSSIHLPISFMMW